MKTVLSLNLKQFFLNKISIFIIDFNILSCKIMNFSTHCSASTRKRSLWEYTFYWKFMFKIRIQSNTYIPGHRGFPRHLMSSISLPWHKLPPCCGDGLSHRLLRVRVPAFPHVKEHPDHSDQAVHFPCTGKKLNN